METQGPVRRPDARLVSTTGLGRGRLQRETGGLLCGRRVSLFALLVRSLGLQNLRLICELARNKISNTGELVALGLGRLDLDA